MKKKIIFKGTATALITPFSDGKIDYSSFEKLIEKQLEAKIPALVVGGTTGEAATLSDTERYELYRFAKKAINGRSKLILGTGTNDTKAAIKHTVFAEELGCDGALVVTPYYNKGTEDGLVRHYLAIASSTNLPIIVYNVPARTGVNLSFSQLRKLSERENIVAIKDPLPPLPIAWVCSGFPADRRLLLSHHPGHLYHPDISRVCLSLHISWQTTKYDLIVLSA